MNNTIKNRILLELDNLPDQKAYSLLDYLHFLNKNSDDIPNTESIAAITQADNDISSLKSYSSAEDIFNDPELNE